MQSYELLFFGYLSLFVGLVIGHGLVGSYLHGVNWARYSIIRYFYKLRCKGDLILHQQSLAPLKVANSGER